MEIKIYERFEQYGGHAGLLRYLGPYESGLRLELASNYGLRKHLQDRGSEIASEQRLRWCQQLLVRSLLFIQMALSTGIYMVAIFPWTVI